MIESKHQRMDGPEDPERCQGACASGQCHFKRIKGELYCPMHNGLRTSIKKKEDLRNYRLQRIQTRVNEFADNSQLKSLREEIGIQRLLLENLLNKYVQTDEDLLLYSDKISSLVQKIESLVVSCHKLERSTGELLEKRAVVNISVQLIEILSSEIKDASLIERISDRLTEVIDATSSPALAG